MNKIIQDLATSLDVLSPALETIAQKTIIIDSFRKTVLDQARSGYVPSTSTELAEISKFSQDAHLILESLEDALMQTDRILQAIKEAENTTRVAYECSQTLLFSPIRKLPPEILTKMFHDHIFSQSEYALGVESQDNGEIVLVPPTLITCPSLHLGWVCSHWRQVVLLEPRFWSSFYIDSQRISPIRNFAELCQEFIFRSGNDSPLKLYIMNRNDNSLDAYCLLNKLFSDHSARWSHVVLGVPSTWFARHSVEAGTFPNLKHLDVVHSHFVHSFAANNSRCITFEMFISCPRLDTYIGRSFEWSTFKVHDFSHLTMLSLEELYAERVAPFLSLLPALKTFSLALDLDDNTADIAPPISYFCHRNLSALHLTTNVSPRIWHDLSLPQVDTYQLTKGRREDNFEWLEVRDKYFSDMSSLFIRSGSILKNLTFNHIPPQALLPFIKQRPTFISLTIGTVDWEVSHVLDDLVEVLDGIMLASLSKAAAASYDYPDVAPKLQSLVINFGRITGSELSELEEDTNWLDKLVEFAQWKAARATESLDTVAKLAELRLVMEPYWDLYVEDGEDKEQLDWCGIQSHPSRPTKRLNRMDRQLMEDIKNRLASVHVGFTLYWGDSILYQTFVLE